MAFAVSRILTPRRDLILPSRFRQRQGGFLLNPYRFGGGGGGGGPGDGIPYANVALQLHGDGANDSYTLTDSSQYARTMTHTGSTGGAGHRIRTGASVFGGASIYMESGTTGGWTTPAGPTLDMRAGAFQVDFRYRLDTNLTDPNQPDAVVAMVDGTTWGFEWSVIVHREYLRFYRGTRGINNQTIRFFFPPGVDMATMGGTWCALSIARDASADWGAWFDGTATTDYQTGNLSPTENYLARVNGGTLNDAGQAAHDMGDSTGRVFKVGSFGGFGGLTVGKHVDEFRYVIGACRPIGVDYTPLATPFPDS